MTTGKALNREIFMGLIGAHLCAWPLDGVEEKQLVGYPNRRS